MDGHRSEEIDLDERDYRSDFTVEVEKFRNNLVTKSKHKPCTTEIVYHMNQQMVNNKVKMTKPHFEAAVESISRGDNIVEFTIAENSFVLSSNGKGFAYKFGYGYHKSLKFLTTPVKIKTSWGFSENPFSGSKD
jgi:hypothetical protein